jgi:hypothetical protein
MGWTAKWASSYGNDFNYDYHVSFTKDDLAKGEIYYNYQMIKDGFDELRGLSVFVKDDAGAVFHTYSSYARGNEEVNAVFIYLDITPKGRNETQIMDWVKRHDEYDGAKAAGCWRLGTDRDEDMTLKFYFHPLAPAPIRTRGSHQTISHTIHSSSAAITHSAIAVHRLRRASAAPMAATVSGDSTRPSRVMSST